MYLSLLNTEQKKLFLSLAYNLAASDGDFSENERHYDIKQSERGRREEYFMVVKGRCRNLYLLLLSRFSRVRLCATP